MPKNIPLGEYIPEHEEWIKPFNPEDDDPNTGQDEQVWANTHHKFVFNALPITDMRPYKNQHQPNKDKTSKTTLVEPQNNQASAAATRISEGYKIPRKSLQSSKINELVNDFNSSRALPASEIAHPSTERETEHREKAKKDRRKSSKPISQRNPESNTEVTDDGTVTSKVQPKSRPRQLTPDQTRTSKGTSKTDTTTKEIKSSNPVSETKREEDQDIMKTSDSNRSRKPRRD